MSRLRSVRGRALGSLFDRVGLERGLSGVQAPLVLGAIVEAVVEDNSRALLGRHLELELGEARASSVLPRRHIDEVYQERHLPPAVVRLVLNIAHVEKVVVPLVFLAALVPDDLRHFEQVGGRTVREVGGPRACKKVARAGSCNGFFPSALAPVTAL